MRAESLRWAVRGGAFALGAAIVYATLYVGLLARDVLLLVFVAVLLGSALEPLVGRLREVANVPRGVTILAVYALFFALVAGVSLLVLPAAVAQLGELLAAAPQYLDRARAWATSLTPAALSQALVALIDAARAAIPTRGPEPGQVVQLGLTAAQVTVSVATVLGAVFFWLVEHARLQRYALSFIPAAHRAGAREAWDDIELRLGDWVRGQLTLMAAMAIATGLLYSVLGLPSALLLGLFAGIAEAVPIVGPIVGAIPALAIAATVRPELVAVVFVFYLVIQFIESNVLVPVIMKHAVGLSAFLVMISLLVGAAIGGILGAFVAVPLMAGIEVVLERLQARRTPVTQAPTETPPVAEEASARPSRPGRPADTPRRSGRVTGRRSATR